MKKGVFSMAQIKKEHFESEIKKVMQSFETAKIALQTATSATMNVLREAAVESTKEATTIILLTIKECLQVIPGLTESTLRRLVAQGKIPVFRPDENKNGKIFINKSVLINYFNQNKY
jgi:hypothetical protein